MQLQKKNTEGIIQHRSFVKIDSFEFKKASSTDIYILKQDSEKIGVKIRNPDITKKQNYLFSRIEVKIMTQKIGKLQKWLKIAVDLKSQFKLKQTTIMQMNEIIKRALQELSKKYQVVQQWRYKQIKALIRIDKDKKKHGGREKGILKVFKLYQKQQKTSYFQTYATESTSESSFGNMNIVSNMSYPFFIQQFYNQ